MTVWKYMFIIYNTYGNVSEQRVIKQFYDISQDRYLSLNSSEMHSCQVLHEDKVVENKHLCSKYILWAINMKKRDLRTSGTEHSLRILIWIAGTFSWLLLLMSYHRWKTPKTCYLTINLLYVENKRLFK